MPTGTYIFVKGAVNYEKNDKIGAFAALGARFGIHLLRIRIRRRAADRDKAKSAVLMDVSTGRVLIGYNENERLYPASVTKIMPLLLIVEAIDDGRIALTDTVTASATAASKGGSQIWLKEASR